MRAALSFSAGRHRAILVAGGVLVTALLMYLSSPRATTVSPSAAPARATSMLVAVRHFVPAGNVIGPGDVGMQAMAGSPPSGAMFSVADAMGLAAQRDLKVGEILHQIDLRDAASVGIAGRLTSGQRALSIHVAEDDIVGGFLQSGDHVDILATFPESVFPTKDAGQSLDRSRALLLLQNVLVLAVGENLNTNGAVQPAARTVSLSLNPAQLSRVTLALRLGRVSLAIRRPGDSHTEESAGVTLRDLVPGSTSLSSPDVSPSRSPKPVKAGIPFYVGGHVASITWSNAP